MPRGYNLHIPDEKIGLNRRDFHGTAGDRNQETKLMGLWGWCSLELCEFGSKPHARHQVSSGSQVSSHPPLYIVPCVTSGAEGLPTGGHISLAPGTWHPHSGAWSMLTVVADSGPVHLAGGSEHPRPPGIQDQCFTHTE